MLAPRHCLFRAYIRYSEITVYPIIYGKALVRGRFLDHIPKKWCHLQQTKRRESEDCR